MPADAIVGGADSNGNKLYICRATLSGQNGWANSGEIICHVGYGGSETQTQGLEWWVPTWQPFQVQTSIPFGFERKQGPPPSLPYSENRYPCKTRYVDPSIGQPADVDGKFGVDLNGCDFPFGGKEIYQAVNGFDVLADEYGNPEGTTATPYSDGAILGTYQAQQMTSDSGLRADAIVGGQDIGGQPLYLCSADFAGGQHPGKYRPGLGGCHVGYNGVEYTVIPFRILVPAWIPASSNNFYCTTIAPNCTVKTKPVQAGTDTNGEPLYICQASVGGGIYPGKITPSFTGGCSVGLNGHEMYSFNYSILTDGVILPRVNP